MKPKILKKNKTNIKLVKAACSCAYTHNASDAQSCSPASVSGPTTANLTA